MIREVGASIGRTVLDGIGRAASRIHERRALSADLLEGEEAYLIVLDAPGATAEDVAVRFEGNALSVRIDRFREFYDGYEMVFPGRGLALSGDVELPEGAAVDADQAEATLTRTGTLEVSIPKTAEAADSETDTEEADVGTITESESEGEGDAVYEGAAPDDGGNTTDTE